MKTVDAGRPRSDEYLAYFGQYIDRVPDGTIADILKDQGAATQALLSPLTVAQVEVRPEPDDWNILQVIGHLTDCERVFSYRALCFARDDLSPLPGFNPEPFVIAGRFEQRNLADVLYELAAARAATVALCRGLEEGAWSQRGLSGNHIMSVRAFIYVIAGHELHHVADLKQRYGLVG